MAKIEWDNSLSTGVEFIDEQHKMLLEKINDISKAVEADRGPEKIGDMLDFLLEYSDFHFNAEESHMREMAYPDLEAHRQQHKEFVETIKELIRDFLEDGPTRELAEAVNTMLVNWLRKHIKTVDAKLAVFLNEKGLGRQ
ncbi:McHr [Limihaloglobus sulfuriphilus]|uniref:McHr n=1 Tax=Limihaloglobus sulfuriphilus TaxID=1851148 RepID=A0A1Q2MEC9_9BACT|nr:bacteriohemerythrin [Limihaloglobus sulfuriphilus]AQQ70612.1 McHr [Limihaloglobus sulfuriphilus]